MTNRITFGQWLKVDGELMASTFKNNHFIGYTRRNSESAYLILDEQNKNIPVCDNVSQLAKNL